MVSIRRSTNIVHEKVSILILSLNLCLELATCLLYLGGFPDKILCEILLLTTTDKRTR